MSQMYPVDIGTHLSLNDLHRALLPGTQLFLTEASVDRIAGCREYLEQVIERDDNAYYGINTGFGSLYNVRIPDDQIETLQTNLIKSHSAGAGEAIPGDVARIVLLLKIISLSKGHSGVRKVLVDQLIAYYNHGLTPVMYEFGSLGASGDLAPLAHLSLTLMGSGAFYGTEGAMPAVSQLEKHGITPITLKAKEGLALINGTQFSTGFGAWAIYEARRIMQWANMCAALSCDAFNCNTIPFDARIHDSRPHRGQGAVARDIMELLNGSEIATTGEKQLQDPYSFRCVPQVHGASLDTLDYATSVIETELNSVTDNPLVFPESEAILSGGNFHAQPIALVLDFLAIALSELGNISERRTYQLLCGHRGLPTYLIEDAGIQSGLMLVQYTAASIVNRNKLLCTPASVDSIISSNGQEDHVSMAANAATKLYEVCRNLKTILAIEFMTAMQALDFRRPAHTSTYLEQIKTRYRNVVPFIEKDTVLHGYMVSTEEFLSHLDQND